MRLLGMLCSLYAGVSAFGAAMTFTSYADNFEDVILRRALRGIERGVIESWPPSPVRPWIVLVESTKPHSQEPSFAGWEPALLALGYEFVYFDGLNRFYVSAEHPELKPSFGPGPNVFDDFRIS